MTKKISISFLSLLLIVLISACSFGEQSVEEQELDFEEKTEEISATPSEPQPEVEEEQVVEQEQEIDEVEEAFKEQFKQYDQNEVMMVNGQAVVQNPENIHAAINREFLLPEGYRPDDLIVPNVRFSFEEDIDKRYLREEAAMALEELFKAAEADGIELYAISGFRSYERQDTLYENAISNHGSDQTVVAMPGQSEHQTGLAMDVSSNSNQFALTADFENTEEGQWVANRAHEFGYIIRYPKGKEEITGYDFEPWHIRYIGEEMAQILYENEWTLEEFLEEGKAVVFDS
ncbi:D-alanyl-D-alanine carboxypeptidase family protein [Alkalihalobacillus trypoxylicola]|uniref:Peptidase M15 n=1 Tax=Alkalihalobacillus trypoxylicola TaxID=519424 RepID=A0A162EEG0_9BACI|nr:M15 family metallopeptidase [Alkalihalobacillus trypoxylicola]KYG32381.1 peptidase M15 [Alkalihalobacillus trypoxylicola]